MLRLGKDTNSSPKHFPGLAAATPQIAGFSVTTRL
jgi:hypothetical protein